MQQKLAPCRTDGRLFATDVSAKSRGKKTRQISKIHPEQIEILCPSLRISGQLIVNGGGDSF